MPWLCRFFIHKWSRFSACPDSEGYAWQLRQCTRCGRIQRWIA